jgi:hypothetical protein
MGQDLAASHQKGTGVLVVCSIAGGLLLGWRRWLALALFWLAFGSFSGLCLALFRRGKMHATHILHRAHSESKKDIQREHVCGGTALSVPFYLMPSGALLFSLPRLACLPISPLTLQFSSITPAHSTHSTHCLRRFSSLPASDFNSRVTPA